MLRLVCKRRLCFQLLQARSRATAPAAPGAVRGLSLRHYKGIKYGSLLELCLARILENFQERKTKLYFDKGVRKVGTDLHEVTSRGIKSLRALYRKQSCRYSEGYFKLVLPT